MKLLCKLSLLAVGLIISAQFIIPVQAGFSVRGLGITHVPIGGESSDKDILEIADNQGVNYPPINVPVPAADIAKLQMHPAFAGMTAQQIQDKVVNIRRAVLCAIDLLKRTDPETAEGLQTNFRAGMICIGLAPANYNVGAAIKNDGQKEFHLEPINIYKLPCSRLPLWDPDLFDLANTLGHEGLHARQDVLGWRDAAPLVVAKDRQCKEIDASQGELDRANEMCRIINFIASNGSLPDDARGMYARIGADLLRAFQGNNAGLQAAITRWRQKLRGIKLRAQEVRTFREAYKNAADLAINGSPDAPQILADLRKHRLFQYYGGSNEFSPITRWYVNEAPRYVPPQGANPPRLERSNRMKQLVPPATEVETFTVDDLDTITAGLVLDDRNLAMIGGIKFAENAGEEDEAVVVGYDLDPVSKRILPDSARVCLRTTAMAGGYIMNYNPWDQKFYALQLDDNEMCELRDTDDDGCPDVGLSVGYFLPEGRSDLDLRLSIPVGSFYFTDADTAVATHDSNDTTFHVNDPLAFAWRLPNENFEGQPSREVNEDLDVRPGIDGCLTIGSQYAPLVGPPWGRFELYDGETMIGEGCFSAHGRAIPHLDQPLTEDSNIWVRDAINACDSVPTRAKSALSDRPKIDITEASSFEVDDFSIGVRFDYNPDFKVRLNYSNDFSDFESNEFDPGDANRFGTNFKHLDLMHLPGGSQRGFFRATTEERSDFTPQPDSFIGIPGVKDYFDVSKNDGAPPTARYELVSKPFGFPDDAFKFYEDGTFDLSNTSFEGAFTLTYKVSFGGFVSEDITATVLPDMNTSVLKDPEEKGAFGDVTFLEVFVLTIGERDYPLYQFSLRPPDACPSAHWHSPGFPTVFPIGLPVTTGISDPNPPVCGYGTLEQLPVRKLIVSQKAWDQFMTDHPCP